MTVAGCPPALARALEGARIDGPAFAEAQRRRGLVQGTRPLCNVLSPLVVSPALHARVSEAAALVAGAVERVVARALVDGALATLLGVTARERELAAVDPGFPWAVGVGRLDMVFTERPGPGTGDDDFAFLELNAESPAGIADQLLLEETLFQLPVVRDHLTPQGETAADALVAALAECYRRWGGQGPPRVAIVDWRQVETSAEQEVLRRLLEERGMPAVLADPDELSFEPGRHAALGEMGRLFARGRPVDLVYRRVVTRELLERVGDDHPLLQAYRARAVCLVNPLRSTIANKKAMFAVLSDPAFCDEEVRRHLPWSRVLGAGISRGEALERQEELVVKPNDDYGGKGVVLGWTVDRAAWAAAIDGGGVVQQRVRPRRLRFPSPGPDGRVRWEELGFDCDPFLFLGRPQGAMVRLSASPVSNVSAGGGVTALLVRDV